MSKKCPHLCSFFSHNHQNTIHSSLEFLFTPLHLRADEHLWNLLNNGTFFLWTYFKVGKILIFPPLLFWESWAHEHRGTLLQRVGLQLEYPKLFTQSILKPQFTWVSQSFHMYEHRAHPIPTPQFTWVSAPSSAAWDSPPGNRTPRCAGSTSRLACTRSMASPWGSRG